MFKPDSAATRSDPRFVQMVRRRDSFKRGTRLPDGSSLGFPMGNSAWEYLAFPSPSFGGQLGNVSFVLEGVQRLNTLRSG